MIVRSFLWPMPPVVALCLLLLPSSSSSMAMAMATASEVVTDSTSATYELDKDERNSKQQEEAIVTSLMEWVIRKGGTVATSLQEYRRRDDNSYGMVATQTIQPNTVLYSVPWKLVLGSDARDLDRQHHDYYDDMEVLPCDSIFRIIQQLTTYTKNHSKHSDNNNNNDKDNNNDDYDYHAPFYDYLLSVLPRGQVPSTWSDLGKDIFEEISGYDQFPPVEPVLWIDKDWYTECLSVHSHGRRRRRHDDRRTVDDDHDKMKQQQQQQEFEEHVAMMVLSHACKNGLLVPLYNLYNHRNNGLQVQVDEKKQQQGLQHNQQQQQHQNQRRQYTNARIIVQPGLYFSLVSTRTIFPNEEIYVSYNQCGRELCDNRQQSHYGTPELLRDYGFVEEYPQSYYFDWLDFGFHIDVVVDEEEEDVLANDHDDDDDDDDEDDQNKQEEVATQKENVAEEAKETDASSSSSSSNDAQTKYVIQWDTPDSKPPSTDDMNYLRWQLMRLEQVVRPDLQDVLFAGDNGAVVVDKKEENSHSGDDNGRNSSNTKNQQSLLLPKSEQRVLQQYYDSLVIALRVAVKAFGGGGDDDDIEDGTSICLGATDTDGTCVVDHDGYDDLERINIKFSNYQSYCDNADLVHMQQDSMRLIERNVQAQIQSPFQLLTYMGRKENNVDDTCLELDDMLQICTSFRPHYHEYVTHFPARYKEEIKRVLFVGGGDSMVLHEMLKYPNIELIVGLELDQAVVRSSMKQFRTQPHFDNDRVQWWFGDATKSLLMLPKEYFGSFDMVMVDLSESVMSFSVIKHVDIMEALALLLKPDGIMIKNDLHFRKMSDIFDYAIQLSVTDVPIICEQAFVVGSNSIDFLRPDVETLTKGHDVEMLLLDPISNMSDSFKLVQKYRKNDAREQGKCDNHIDDSDVKLKRAGLFMVVEAENAKGPLKGDKFEEALQSALKGEGLRPVSTMVTESATKGSHVVIVMREGIVVARTWPNEQYCAFDIHLWGRFNAMDSIRNALSKAVQSPHESVSSFRIVVGGMRGTDTWKQDKKEIGPRILQHRDCEEHPATGTLDESVIDAVVEESLNLVQEKDPLVIVMCGFKGETCRSFSVVRESKVGNVKAVPLYSCPEIENIEFMGDAPLRMSVCELATLKTLRNAVEADKAVSALVVDDTAPIAMGKIVRNILRNSRHRDKFLMPSIMFIAPMMTGDDLWRRTFLDRSRSNLRHSSVFRVELLLRATNDEGKVDILSSGDSNVFPHLVDFANGVEARTGVVTEIRDIIGAPPKRFDEYDPHHFVEEDYDRSAGQAQFSGQKPLGHHIVSLLKTPDLSSSKETKSSFETELVAGIEKSLAEATFSMLETQVFNDLGEGIVVVTIAPQGTAVAVWDGNQRTTLNMFTFDSDHADTFMKRFLKEFKSATVLSRDEQPRGIGRVINFARDLE